MAKIVTCIESIEDLLLLPTVDIKINDISFDKETGAVVFDVDHPEHADDDQIKLSYTYNVHECSKDSLDRGGIIREKMMVSIWK